MVIVAESGEVLYDHTFEVTPPSSTTSTTEPFITYYSGPRLDVSPREGVSLTVTVSKATQGWVASIEIYATIWIHNASGSPFHFSVEDLQLYLNGARAEPGKDSMFAPVDVAAQADGEGAAYFELSEFDPSTAGLLYTSSDARSRGFTASDGPTPATDGLGRM